MEHAHPHDGTGSAQDAQQANPDLDRILAELAGYTASQANNASRSPSAALPFPSHQDYSPQIPSSSNLLVASTTPQPASRGSLPQHATKPVYEQTGTPPAQPSTPQIDPSTIFEWTRALRCVNKISASNPHFGPKIREMMADQDRNVKQWWEDRNNLVNSQKTRNEGRRSLNEVLKGIGGKLEAESTPEQDQAELEKFDKKVYGASQQMSSAHNVELKRLGVPFFGVDPKYVIANEFQQTKAARDALSQATITEVELLDLQRKMIQYLEDMYKD